MMNTMWRSLSVRLSPLRRLKLIRSRHIVRPYTEETLGRTTLIMQDGLDMQELPLIVKKMSFQNELTPKSTDVVPRSAPDLLEIREIIEGFRRCNSSGEILKLLEVVPSYYVTGAVALCVLKRLLEMDSATTEEDFTRAAVFKQLLDVVLQANDMSVLLRCFRLIEDPRYAKLQPYADKLVERILLIVTENKCTVAEGCEAVLAFKDTKYRRHTDALWPALVTEGVRRLDAAGLVTAYATLPHLRRSRRVVLNALQKSLNTEWWRLEGRGVADILADLRESHCYSHRALQIFGRWLNTKIHVVSEDELLLIVNGFKAFDFVNPEIVTALERYVKVKGLRIKNSALFASIMNYITCFRVRSAIILDKCCDYVIEHGSALSPCVLKSVLVPFGYLNYSPVRGYEFWKAAEDALEKHFGYMNAEHALDTLLACLYLERYPLNFTNAVFNPLYLQRLRTATGDRWTDARSRLALYDFTMTLECRSYNGPLLPARRDDINAFAYDERVSFVMKRIRSSVEAVAQSHGYTVAYCKKPPQCPSNGLYYVDALLVPEGGQPFISDYSNANPPFVALLIHTPDQYADTVLIGPQAMRIRHLKKIGLRVVHLQYNQLIELHTEGAVKRYIMESMKLIE